MIRYSLVCDNAHAFEGWFRDSADFSAQAGDSLLSCPVCGSRKVEKQLMAPAVVGSRKDAGGVSEAEDAMAPAAARDGETGVVAAGGASAAAKTMLSAITPDERKVLEIARQLRKAVEKSADYVGKNFAEEARRIHYGEAEARGIYGETTPDDAAALLEEGVDVLPLPMLPEEQN